MSDPVHNPPDLTRRFRMEVCFPEPDEPESWDTINSFATPMEALHGCSECLETVKDLLGTPLGKDLEDAYVLIRVGDARDRRLVLWEDEDGALLAKSVFLESTGSTQPC